jgi:hypothetical protein
MTYKLSYKIPNLVKNSMNFFGVKKIVFNKNIKKGKNI